MKKTALLFFLLIFVFLSAFSEGFNFTPGHRSTEVSIQIVSNVIIMPVKVNGHRLNFILDTGTRSIVLLGSQLKKRLGLDFQREVNFAGLGAGKEIKGQVVLGVNVKIGNVEGKELAAVVLERGYEKVQQMLDVKVDGIIGYDLFVRFLIDIDYTNTTVRLSEPSDFVESNLYYEMPISLHDTKPYLQSTVLDDNGNPMVLNLFVDTGASCGLFLDADIFKGETKKKRRLKRQTSHGLNGKLVGHTTVLNQVRFGYYEINQYAITFISKKENPNFIHDDYRHGSIGGKLLKMFRVVINYPDGKLYLKRNKEFLHFVRINPIFQESLPAVPNFVRP